MNRLLFVAAALGVLALACKPATDLNQLCKLVKRNPDGGRPIEIVEREVRNAQGADKDFISFGAVECEDLVCVRDSRFGSDAGSEEPATGYCSRQCVVGNACPSFSEELDKGPTALRCRAMLLSEEVLAELARDGGFAGVQDPYFCARGGSADGGL